MTGCSPCNDRIRILSDSSTHCYPGEPDREYTKALSCFSRLLTNQSKAISKAFNQSNLKLIWSSKCEALRWHVQCYHRSASGSISHSKHTQHWMDHVRSHLTTSKSDCDFPSPSRDCQFWVLGEIAEEGDFSLQFVLIVALTTDRVLSH